MNIGVKKKVYKYVCYEVQPYIAVKKKTEKRSLETFEILYWIRMERIRCLNRKTNAEVLTQLGEVRSTITAIKKRR